MLTISELLAPQPDPRAPTPDDLPVFDVALRFSETLIPGSLEQQLVLARRQQGIDRYGTALCTHNGRDTRADAAQEAVDMAIYLHQLGYELRGKANSHQLDQLAEMSEAMLGFALWMRSFPKP